MEKSRSLYVHLLIIYSLASNIFEVTYLFYDDPQITSRVWQIPLRFRRFHPIDHSLPVRPTDRLQTGPTYTGLATGGFLRTMLSRIDQGWAASSQAD